MKNESGGVLVANQRAEALQELLALVEEHESPDVIVVVRRRVRELLLDGRARDVPRTDKATARLDADRTAKPKTRIVSSPASSVDDLNSTTARALWTPPGDTYVADDGTRIPLTKHTPEELMAEKQRTSEAIPDGCPFCGTVARCAKHAAREPMPEPTVEQEAHNRMLALDWLRRYDFADDVHDPKVEELACLLASVRWTGRQEGVRCRESDRHTSKEDKVPDELAPLAARIAKGRAKYANGCTVLSLIDETGEVAHAVNKYESADRIRDELLDVAAVAMRLYFGEIDRGLQMDGLVQRRHKTECLHSVHLETEPPQCAECKVKLPSRCGNGTLAYQCAEPCEAGYLFCSPCRNGLGPVRPSPSSGDEKVEP